MNDSDIDSATYSPEDNKLRLYPLCRLDDETYQRVKAAGFKWAPRQELFVAPMWTPAREDLCLDLAGEIDLEGTTLAERAEAKAARLDELSRKRLADSNAFHRAADQIGKRFEGGQPILVGHHSEKRARKDQEKMHRAMDNALRAYKLADYWSYRASGVERHAAMKGSARVRANRIKTLLSELRGIQRSVNFSAKALRLWEEIDAMEDQEKRKAAALHYAGAYSQDGSFAPRDTWNRLDKGEISTDEAIALGIEMHSDPERAAHRERWLSHILGRLGFERSELGEVSRFDGELTAVILQGFARTHGADKPKATRSEAGWILQSPVPLPRHLAEGEKMELGEDGWRDLMQSAGYAVEIREAVKRDRPKQAPLINPTMEDAERLQAMWNDRERAKKDAYEEKNGSYRADFTGSTVRAVRQETYSANAGGTYSKCETIELNKSGQKIWRSRGFQQEDQEAVCRVRVTWGDGKSGYTGFKADSLVHLTDKPAKPLPLKWPEPEKPASEPQEREQMALI